MENIGHGSIIYPTAEIGEGAVIDEYCIIKDGVKIGKNCRIYPQVLIMPNTVIGDNTKIGDGASIRENCVIGNNSSIGSKVRIENDTIIGDYVSIETQTHITAYMQIDDYVFIGPMVVTSNDFYMNWKRPNYGKGMQGPYVKKGARIGLGAKLLPKVIVGEYAIVNAGEIVRKDVPDNVLFFTRKGQVVYKPVVNNLVS